jgi:hypothetical protein
MQVQQSHDDSWLTVLSGADWRRRYDIRLSSVFYSTNWYLLSMLVSADTRVRFRAFLVCEIFMREKFSVALLRYFVGHVYFHLE